MQSIILLCTGTNTGGGYLAPRWLFLVMYIGLTLIWAVLNTFALEVIAFLDVISMWWQVITLPNGCHIWRGQAILTHLVARHAPGFLPGFSC